MGADHPSKGLDVPLDGNRGSRQLERPTIAEFYQRAIGEGLPEAATRVKVG